MKNRTLFGRILAAAVILMAVSLWFPAGSKEARADGIKPTIGTHKATFSGIDPIKLYDDMVFDWNVFFEDDVDLNGHTLTVHGNVIQVEDTVHINGGRLIIDGGETGGLAEQESVNIRRDNVEILLQQFN